MYRVLAVAFGICFSAGLLEASQPQMYFYVGNEDLLTEEGYRIQSNPGTTVDWADGNILVIASWNANNCYPSDMNGYGNSNFGGTASLNGIMKPYGIIYSGGERYLKGSGRIELGAGGYEQKWNNWDDHLINLTGGVHLADSQKWIMYSGVDLGGPLTAKEGITWTLSTDDTRRIVSTKDAFRYQDNKSDFASRGVGLVIRNVRYLTDVTVVIEKRARLHMIRDYSALNAKNLVLDGDCALLCRDFNATFDPEISGKYATNLVLRNGASPALQTFYFNMNLEVPKAESNVPTAVDGVIYDLDSVTIESGTSVFGAATYDGADTGRYSYSVKNGGTLPVVVNSGAKVKFADGPTAGTIAISGAGSVDGADLAFEGVRLAEDFTGTVLYTQEHFSIGKLTDSFPAAANFIFDSCDVRIADLTGFTGTFTLRNGTRIALPATGTWPDGVTVKAEDDASVVYLPAGKEVDELKLLGVGRYDAVARGVEEETAAEVTVNAGEVLVVCGDGFTDSTKIVMNGGVLKIPVGVSVASPVEVKSKSYLATGLGVEAVFSGTWTLYGIMDITNATQTTVRKAGRSIFTGSGTVNSGGFHVNAGDMEFRGPQCLWTFKNGGEIIFCNNSLNLKICEGAYVNFADAEEGKQASRNGLRIGSASSYPVLLEVTTNSTLRIGPWHRFQMGRDYYGCKVTVDVNGGTLLVKGDTGEFNVHSSAPSAFINSSSVDRCSSVKLYLRNGGVLETDRLCTSPPITHTIESATRTEGLAIFFDDGTWRLGENFGAYANDNRPWQHPNMLFGGAANINSDAQLGLTNTCEVTVNVGPGGGTFDLSRAREGNTSFTNTVMNVLIPVITEAQKEYFKSEYFPNRGPQWNIEGRLTVKGNGNQEFVINGLDASKLGLIGADGATVKVVSDNPAVVSDLTLGCGAGGWSVETENGEPRKLTVGRISLDEGGRLDADCFDTANLEVNDVVCGAGAVLCAPENGTPLSVLGTVTFSQLMGYYSAELYSGLVLSAAKGILVDGGEDVSVTWTPESDSRTRVVRIKGNGVFFEPKPLKLIFR